MSTSSTISVTDCFYRMADGDESAARKLFQHYYDDVWRLAQRKLRNARKRVADESDVAQLAFEAFFRAAQNGRYPDIRDRNNLWSLLVEITANKAKDVMRHEGRAKRGGNKVQGESALGEDGLNVIVGTTPSPEFIDSMFLECEHLLGCLDELLQKIALWKLEGHTNKEISQKIDRTEETVRRKVVRIRTEWQEFVNT